MSYSETITSVRALLKYIEKHNTEHLRNAPSIDAPSKWDASYLFKCRVVCPKPDGKRFLGIAKVEDENNPEWEEVIKPFPKRLNRRPYPHYHQHFRTGTAANYWEALQTLNMAIRSDFAPPSTKRSRSRERGLRPAQETTPEYKSTMKITSNSPEEGSSDSSDGRDDPSFAPAAGHDMTALPEDATVNAIMACIKHSLTWYGPQKGEVLGDEDSVEDDDGDDNEDSDDDDDDSQQPVLSASPIRYAINGKIPSFRAKIQATSDGEIQANNIIDGEYAISRKEVVAIIEAKRRFTQQHIQDGKATIPDRVLAQVVGEALALRGTELCRNDTVITIVAIRNYVCFLSVHIPATYYDGTVNDVRDPKMDIITVKPTAWLNQDDSKGRKDILCNVARIVEWSRLGKRMKKD
ncbi:hypothetical protein GGTG_08592 [Gaeumannomyces tritici R3-111a-1]|uniref:Uncharacterized protein n=1 Tax=Gaeumannomyces tritici (strain R3-111a-1) TaxID=644352 RepID=J3P506_GAET3|nr:hypothetical protein GGTG_08592 [Gaeumannomyces tritici R3-111a-1]EJT74754.1 hypothetical protein GGTG_08592 [Gaeumannomyces tritici R3-111a-1]